MVPGVSTRPAGAWNTSWSATVNVDDGLMMMLPVVALSVKSLPVPLTKTSP